MKIYNVVFGGILALYFSELIFPPITTIVSATTVCFLCFIAWVSISLLMDKSFYLKLRVQYICPILAYLLPVILAYLFGNLTIAHRYMVFALVPLGNMIYSFHQSHNQLIMMRKIIKIQVVLSIITGVVTISALLANPYISRSIKSSGEHSLNLARQGIGGYSFIYFAATCGVLILHILWNTKSIKVKIAFGTLLLFDAFLIVKSSYTTALLVFVGEIIIYITLRIGKNRKLGVWRIVLMLLLIFALWGTLLLYSDKILEILPPRVASIFVSGEGGNAFELLIEEFVLDRGPQLQLSVDAFLRHPLFGLLGSGKIGYDGQYLTGFGQHSFILDTFAIYGALVGLIVLLALFAPFKNAFKEGKNAAKYALSISVLTGMLVLYLFNNATESIGFAIGILFPYVRDNISSE